MNKKQETPTQFVLGILNDMLMMSQAEKFKLVAGFGVDSGGFIACDRQALSEWEPGSDRETNQALRRRYKHKSTGILLEFGGFTAPEDMEKGVIYFSHYEEVIPELGKTMNALNSDGETDSIPPEPVTGFSYGAYCSSSSRQGAFITSGSGCKALSSSTSYGDGHYGVYRTTFTKPGSDVVILDVGNALACIHEPEPDEDEEDHVVYKDLKVVEVDPETVMHAEAELFIGDPCYLPRQDGAILPMLRPTDFRVFRVDGRDDGMFGSLLWYVLVPKELINGDGHDL